MMINRCDENMKMITIHENDIQFIQEKVNQINQSMIYNIHAFQKIIRERQDLLCQIFSIQDEKLACCLTYDNLVNMKLDWSSVSTFNLDEYEGIK